MYWNRKWMMGMSDTRFCPGVTMSRAMMVTVLYRMAGNRMPPDWLAPSGT